MSRKTVTSRFVLKGDNRLASAFSKAQKQVSSIAKSVGLVGVAAAAAIKVSIDFADNIGKSADAIGLGVEQLQEYEFAANRAGIATTQFSSNMTAFVKRVGEAKAGMGPLVSGLKNLNPVLLENLKNSTNQGDALRLVADAIQNAKSATERAAIANAAFSRSGIGMVVMLRDGSRGLDDFAATARGLGVVMDEELVRNAELAADKMGDLQKVMQVRIATVVTENADSIIAFTGALIDFLAKAPGFIRFYKDEFNALFGFIDNADFLRLDEKLADLKEELAGVQNAPLGAFGDFFSDARVENIARINEEIRVTQNLLDEIEAKRRDASGQGQGGGDDVLMPVVVTAQKREKELAEIMARIKSMMRLDAEQDTADAARARNALELEYASIIASTRTAQEAHTAQITRIGELFAEEVIPSAEEYADVINRLNADFVELPEQVEVMGEKFEEMNEFAVQAARNIQTQFADFLFDPFDQGMKGMLKGFANTIRRMIAEAASAQILKTIFGGVSGGSGGFFASLFGSLAGKASGGPIAAGVPYLVGERGPEVIVPRGAGTVVPNNRIGGNTVTVNIDARQSDDPGRLLALVPVISAQIEQSITLKSRRGML